MRGHVALCIAFAAGCGTRQATVRPLAAVEACPARTWLPLAELTPTEAAIPDLAEHGDVIVERVLVRGVVEPLATTLRGAVATRPGTPLHAAPLRDDLRSLWALGVVGDARVAVAGTTVIFEVTPRPTIARVVGQAVPELQRFAMLSGTPYEPARIARMAAAAELAYQRGGHLDARIAVTRAQDRGLELCVVAIPGPRVVIDALKFPGRKTVPEAALLAVIRGGAAFNHPGGVYDPGALEVDRVTVLLEELYERGLIEARIQPARAVRSGDRVTVSLPIEEGPVFRIGKVSGPDQLPTTIAPGDVFRRSQIIAAQGALQDVVGDRGTVLVRTQLDPNHALVDVELYVEEHP